MTNKHAMAIGGRGPMHDGGHSSPQKGIGDEVVHDGAARERVVDAEPQVLAHANDGATTPAAEQPLPDLPRDTRSTGRTRFLRD